MRVLTSTLSLLLLPGLASLATAAAPFAIAQSTFGPQQESLINNDVQSFLASQTDGAFSAAQQALATATGAAADLLHEYEGNPNLLADEYFTATATPTWYSELPNVLKNYVNLVAGEEASIASRDALSTQVDASTAAAPASTSTAGAAVAGVDGQLGVVGAVIAAGLAGVAWL